MLMVFNFIIYKFADDEKLRIMDYAFRIRLLKCSKFDINCKNENDIIIY